MGAAMPMLGEQSGVDSQAGKTAKIYRPTAGAPMPLPALLDPGVLRFHLACIPPKTSHHAKRIVRVGQFSRLADKPELVAAKGMLDGLLLPHQPAAPIVGPVSLELELTWPWRSSESKRVRALCLS